MAQPVLPKEAPDKVRLDVHEDVQPRGFDLLCNRTHERNARTRAMPRRNTGVRTNPGKGTLKTAGQTGSSRATQATATTKARRWGNVERSIRAATGGMGKTGVSLGHRTIPK